MSYPNQQQPRRTAPLIQRPSAAAPPPPAASNFSSSLGASIAGALGGMGYAQGQTQPGYYGAQPAGAYGAAGHPGMHQLGQPQQWQAQAGGYAGQGQYGQHGAAPYGYASADSQAHYGHPQQPPPQQHPSAYPPSFHPPQHHQPPPAAHPYPYQSTSAAPYPPTHPQQQQAPSHTTADGYTLSSTYSGPPPSSISSSSRPGRGAPSAPARAPKQPREPAAPQVVSCAQPGCAFTGSKKLVREHEEDRHLIFAPGREPKPWDGSLSAKEGAVIEGTGLALDTPEAVARWIEERKKRWPSKKVVDEKERARAERVAAGLEAPPRERGGRGRGRGRGMSEARGRGRGRGGRGGAVGDRGWDGAMEVAEGEPPAKKARLEGEADGASGSSSSGSDSDSDDSDGEDGPPEEASTRVAPAELAGEGDASDEDEEDAGEPPEAQDATGDAAGGEGAPQKRFQVVCRHWRRGNCGLGDECPYLHELPSNALPPPPPKRRRPAPPPAAHNPFARPAAYADPFALLEERDRRHLVSDVLQVIEFLGANDWLAGVEIRRGQVDEESGIEVLPESAGASAELKGGKEARIEEVPEAAAPELVLAVAEVPAPVAPAAVEAEPALSTPAPAAPTSPPPALAPAVKPAAPAQAPLGGLGAMFADYGSDTDDEAEEELVAAALTGRA
ncbi:hypothetical protein JCM10450v2_000339 [Rhodotorula kratochvilovae]